MKYALIIIMTAYLPVQGPTLAGPPLNKLFAAGPDIHYTLMADKKACLSYKNMTSLSKPKPVYAECIPSPAGNLCDAFWKKTFIKNERHLNGCILETGEGYGPTFGWSNLFEELKLK